MIFPPYEKYFLCSLKENLCISQAHENIFLFDLFSPKLFNFLFFSSRPTVHIELKLIFIYGVG